MSSTANQENSEDYVKRVGIEYRFGCYEEKRADSCHLLGEYKEAVEKNIPEALKLFKRNCEVDKYAPSCFKYGRYLLSSKHCEKDWDKAASCLEVACDAKIPPACQRLGLVLWNGTPKKPPNPAAAARRMEQACELDDPESCWLLSTWHLGPAAAVKNVNVKGQKGDKSTDSTARAHLPRNMDLALKYGTKACDMGSPHSCANVSRMYRNGDGVPKDVQKAEEFKQRAIDLVKMMNEASPFTA
uniref:Uncharacterized protein n=1 Tax=Plectus sambesii TaxID=2011161 RepID=A0A914UJE2_9BILA